LATLSLGSQMSKPTIPSLTEPNSKRLEKEWGKNGAPHQTGRFHASIRSEGII